MTLLFIDGFDHYATADLSKKGYIAGILNVSSSYKRLVGQGVRSQSSTYRLIKATTNTNATYILGIAFYINSTGALVYGADAQIAFLENGTYQIKVHFVGNDIQVRNGAGTLLGTATNALIYKTWHYLQVKILVDDTVGTVDVILDGSNVLSLSGIDTKATSNAYIDGFWLAGGCSVREIWYDDLYTCSGAGSVNNDFLGDCRIDTLYPDGAGNYSQWTPSAGSNYENVDEAQMDADTTYNSTGTASNRDSYTLDGLSAIGSTIHGIQTVTTVSKDDAGARTVRPFLRVSSTDYDTGSATPIPDSYTSVLAIDETNPDDSAAWEEADVNALESGIKLVS